MRTEFARDLTETIERCRHNDWRDNWDLRRFGPQARTARAKSAIKGVLQTVGVRANPVQAALNEHEEQLQWLYERLQDDESRDLMIDLMAYRVLGHRKVRLPLNTPATWQTLNALERRAQGADSIALDFRNWKLSLYDLSDEGYPLRVYASPTGVFTQLLLQQYRCAAGDHVIEAGVGETVIDAGGCYGETALYFAHNVGVSGRVFSFEFMPNNTKVFVRNLALNPDLAARVEIVANPAWSISGLNLFVEGVGPSARVTSTPKDPSSMQVDTLSIDGLVQREHLERVHFIKMDIEGAELEALRGARAVIQRDQPKLAISVYHRLHDFWTIPQWIESLGMGYRFYLRHFTIHAEETVLFAETVETQRAPITARSLATESMVPASSSENFSPSSSSTASR